MMNVGLHSFTKWYFTPRQVSRNIQLTNCTSCSRHLKYTANKVKLIN